MKKYIAIGLGIIIGAIMTYYLLTFGPELDLALVLGLGLLATASVSFILYKFSSG